MLAVGTVTLMTASVIAANQEKEPRRSLASGG
jgi:hypothetical protein